MDTNRWEATLVEHTVQHLCSLTRTHKDNHLIELEVINEIMKLMILLFLSKLDVVLLKSMESELRLIINNDLEWIIHELLTNCSHIFIHSGTVHHNLFLIWGLTEDLLDISSHFYYESYE